MEKKLSRLFEKSKKVYIGKITIMILLRSCFYLMSLVCLAYLLLFLLFIVSLSRM